MSMETQRETPSSRPSEYRMWLFVTGDEANSRMARRNLCALCDTLLAGRHQLELVDVLQDSESAMEHRILVTPTLLVRKGGQEFRVLGNLSNRDKLLAALGLGDG